MTTHTHEFIQTYKGLGAFGMDRQTDEHTIMFYLQKFSDDRFMETFLPRLSDTELATIHQFITGQLKRHLTESEYHRLFLKDR